MTIETNLYATALIPEPEPESLSSSDLKNTSTNKNISETDGVKRIPPNSESIETTRMEERQVTASLPENFIKEMNSLVETGNITATMALLDNLDKLDEQDKLPKNTRINTLDAHENSENPLLKIYRIPDNPPYPNHVEMFSALSARKLPDKYMKHALRDRTSANDAIGVQKLLEDGAIVDTGNKCFTPLFYALSSRPQKWNIAKMLIDRAGGYLHPSWEKRISEHYTPALETLSPLMDLCKKVARATIQQALIISEKSVNSDDLLIAASLCEVFHIPDVSTNKYELSTLLACYKFPNLPDANKTETLPTVIAKLPLPTAIKAYLEEDDVILFVRRKNSDSST